MFTNLRYWLIEKLAGSDAIAINITFTPFHGMWFDKYQRVCVRKVRIVECLHPSTVSETYIPTLAELYEFRGQLNELIKSVEAEKCGDAGVSASAKAS